MGKKDIFFNASAITFNLFICSVPFTLIIISIIGYVLSFDRAFQEVVRYGTELIPNFSYQSDANDVIKGADTIKRILLPLVGARKLFGIIGIIVLMFFTQGLVYSIKHVIFEVFDIEDRKHPLLEIFHNFFGFGIVGAVFLYFSLTISLISLFDLSTIHIPFTDIVIDLPWIYNFFDSILPIFFTFLLIYVVFRYVSERKISTKVSMMGALTFTFLFELAKQLVGLYLGHAFATYRHFYQGYAVFFILSIWVFYSAIILVLTAILARAYKETFLSHKPDAQDNPYLDIS